MIPKIIHYCWFGGNPLPELAIKCIDSWKKYFPEYEIKEWNESNFDLSACDYIKEAYEAKKWAFVSDYARFKILYEYGGLYFDTDVEVIKNMTDIIDKGPFMGTELAEEVVQGFRIAVNPGLGLAVNPGHVLYKEILEYYQSIHFRCANGNINNQTVVKYTTCMLVNHGYKGEEDVEDILGIRIYAPEYFGPKNYITGKISVTEKTYSIHHYIASWHSIWDKIATKIENCDKKAGIKFKFRRILSLPFRVIAKVNNIGIRNTIVFIFSKFNK